MSISITKLKEIEKFIQSQPELFIRMTKAADVSQNKNRQEIMNILEKNGPMNITQIQKKIGLAYKNVLNHIKKLEEVKLVKTEKQEKEMGRQVIVTLTSKQVEVYEKTMKNISNLAKKFKKE